MSSELRYTANTQLEHCMYTLDTLAQVRTAAAAAAETAKIVGTSDHFLGHADLSKYEWLTHQHRDTLSSIVSHPPLLSYLAIADGEAIGRVKFEMTERMLQPCGPPPPKEDD